MDKRIVFLMLGILSLSLVSAHSNYYDVDDYSYKEKIVESKYYPSRHQVYSRTTYIDYDNDKRFSTDNYKYGYSYRTSVSYRDKYYSVGDYYEDYKKDYKKDKKDYRGYYYKDKKDYYYEYVPYLREYRKKTCYPDAPKGKLFYIKC